MLRDMTEFFPHFCLPLPQLKPTFMGWAEPRSSRRGAGERGIPHREKQQQQQATGKGKRGGWRTRPQGGHSDRRAEWVRSPARSGSLPKSWKQTSRRSLASGPPTGSSHAARFSPRPMAPAVPPSHQHHPPAGRETMRHAAVWQGKFTVHARRIRAPQLCLPFAGATPGRVKRPPSTAGPARGWVCPARSSLALPCLAPPAGQGPWQDLPQALPRLRGGNHPGRSAAPPQHGQRTGTETLQTFIEGDLAHCGPGHHTLGQRPLPGEKTLRGKYRVPPRLPAQPQPSWHTGPCPGAGAQPAADSSDRSRTHQRRSGTFPCDPGHLLAIPSAG